MFGVIIFLSLSQKTTWIQSFTSPLVAWIKNQLRNEKIQMYKFKKS